MKVTNISDCLLSMFSILCVVLFNTVCHLLMSCHNFSLFIRVPCILFYGDLLTLKTHHHKPNSMNSLNSMKELWKNSNDQLITDNNNTQFLVYFGIRAVQATVGIIGNICSFIIISGLKQRVNGHVIMVYLAVSDILVFCVLPMIYLRNSSIINEKHWKNFCVISEYFYSLIMVCSVISYITTSIDRYVNK